MNIRRRVAFSFGTMAVGFAAAQSPFNERAADGFAPGRRLLDNLFWAMKEGLFRVHILHINVRKGSSFFKKPSFFKKGQGG
jgi:hypothetical protein